MELSLAQKMCKEHIRKYKQEFSRAALKKKANATLQNNMNSIEASYGAAPTRNGAGPNTSLLLEPIPGRSRPQSRGATMPPATSQVGLGGYPTTMPTLPASTSPFDGLAANLIQSVETLFGMNASTATGHESSLVTPLGPPSKKPKVTHFKFLRKDDNNGTKYSTILTSLDYSETIKSLKSRCAKKPADKVFKFRSEEQQ